MALVGLGVTLTLARQTLGEELGYRRHAWVDYSTAQQDHIEQIHVEADRLLYNPPLREAIRRGLLPERFAGYRWSFLYPRATITLWAAVTTGAVTVGGVGNVELTVASATFYASMVGHTITADTSGNEYTIESVDSTTQVTVDADASGDDGDTFSMTPTGAYPLPVDCAQVEGDLYYEAYKSRDRLQMTSMERVLSIRQTYGDSLAIPAAAAMVPRESAHAAEQGYDLEVAPIPDADYTMDYQYQRQPGSIAEDDTLLYPLGGEQHGGTYLAALRAAAEWVRDRERGQRYQDFLVELAGSVMQDQGAKPKRLGRMPAVDAARRREVRNQPATTTHNGIVVS